MMKNRIEKREGHLDHNVNCQNCREILGVINWDEKLFRYSPSDIPSVSQSLDNDQTLLTLQCPNCGCFLQIKN